LHSSNFAIKSLAIQRYLHGKSRDQIAEETGSSADKISFIINDWKRKIGIPEIDEFIAFVITVKKSGISIAQCAQGYRMYQLMNSLGVADENNNNRIIRIEGKNIQFHTVVQDIYLNCKILGIPPTILPLWIKDLFDFYYDSNNNIRSFNGYDKEFKKQITPTILKNATFTFHQDTITKAGSALNLAGYSNNQNSCLYKNKISPQFQH
jgi:hypothetical protein